MSLSIRALQNAATATLGNRESPEQDFLSLVNEWVWAFFTLHPWAFNERPLKQLDFVASQPWVSLPADFGQLVSVEATGGLIQRVQKTTMEQIAYLRANGIAPIAGNAVYYVAVEHDVPDPATAGILTPRLAVHETPTANVTGALTICYIAGSPDLQSDNAYIPIPNFARACFLQGWRHYLRGLEEEDTAPMSARMASWLADPLTQGAMSWDGGVQQNIGTLQGGAIRQDYGTFYNYDGVVSTS